MTATTDPERGVLVAGVDRSVAVRLASAFLSLTFGLPLAIYLPIIATRREWIDVPALSDSSTVGVLSALAICTPALAVLLLSFAHSGMDGLRDAVSGVTRWRLGRRWWAITLLLGPLLVVVPYATYLLLGGVFRPSPALALFDHPVGLVVLVVLAAGTILLAFGEELGWRGYLLPLLQTRFDAAVSSLVLGVFWSLWHLPLRFVDGSNSGFPLVLWGMSIVATAFVYTWLFNNTGGSIAAVTVFHGLLNVSNGFVVLQPAVTGDPLSAYVIVGINVLFALVVVLVYGTTSFTRRPGRNSTATLDD